MAGILTINRKKIVFLSFISIVALTAVLIGGVGCKQSGKGTYVIGYVNPNPEEKEGAHGFLRSMPKLGYIEGKNTTYIKCESRESKIIDNALKDMAAKKVDLIFTMTMPAAIKAKQFTQGTNIPVVFVLYDAMKSGVVKSLTKPGGNLTGIELRGSTPKTLEWLLAIAPASKHIFVPVCFDTGAAKTSLSELEQSAAKTGFKLTISEVCTVDALNASLSSMPKNINAVFMLHSWFVGNNVRTVIAKANERRIPVISAGHVNFNDGLVMSYGPLDDYTGMQAARLAHGILRGTPPADLPVETSEFRLGINLETARSAGVKIPNDVLEQADLIIR